MIKIDEALLAAVGLDSMPRQDKNLMLRYIYETLEQRVGLRIADQLNSEELDQFEEYFERKDDAGAFAWLEKHVPDYKEVVLDEFQALKREVTENALSILADYAADAAGVVAATQTVGSPERSVSSPTEADDMELDLEFASVSPSATTPSSTASGLRQTPAAELRRLLAEQRARNQSRSKTKAHALLRDQRASG